MPITKNTILPLNLAKYDVLVEETTESSKFFNIKNLPPVLAGGRNSFLLAGSEYLKTLSEIKIEILDSRKNPIYQSLVPGYSEANSAMISVEIYDDTAPGLATIILMGKAIKLPDDQPIPEQWKNVYNVRWTKTILVDYAIKNSSPVRFTRTPSLTVNENRFLNVNTSSFTTQTTPFTASLFPLLKSSVQNGYIINAVTPTILSADYLGGVITGSLSVNGNTENIEIPITKILNSSTAFSTGHFINSPVNGGIIKKLYLFSGSYTTDLYNSSYGITSSAKIQYSLIESASTNAPISYANLRVSNISTVSGELYKLRVYSKVETDSADYKLIGDVTIGTEELLITSSIRGNTPIGDFYKTKNYQDNWYAGKLVVNTGSRNQLYTVSGSPRYYDSSIGTGSFTLDRNETVLLSSIYANVPVNTSTNKFANQISQSGYFIGTTQNYTLFSTSEYTLTLDAYYINPSGSTTLVGNDFVVDIYLVGASGTSIASNDPLGQFIGQLVGTGNSAWFEKKQFNFNPAGQTTGTYGIRFVVRNGFWYFSNISLKPASDPQFSPDETTVLVPNTEHHNQLLRYKVEFFDINNNSVNLSTESAPSFFTGSVIDMGTLP